MNISQMVKVQESGGFPIERQKASLESITQAGIALIGTGEIHHLRLLRDSNAIDCRYSAHRFASLAPDNFFADGIYKEAASTTNQLWQKRDQTTRAYLFFVTVT